MMKPTIPFFCLVLAGGVAADPAEPRPAPPAFEKGENPSLFDESDSYSPKFVQITVEFIEVAQSEATRMLYKEKLGKDGDQLRLELQKLVDEGKATICETMMASARSGQKATAESIREVIYPTEYEKPEVPSQVTADANTAEPKTPGPPEKPRQPDTLMTPPNPTSFETRNTGSTLEIEPTLGDDNKTIDLRFVPELVFHTGRSIYQQKKDSLGNEMTIEMPLFYSMRTNTALTMFDGQSQLAGLLSPKNAEGVADPSRKTFVIVRGDVVVVKVKK